MKCINKVISITSSKPYKILDRVYGTLDNRSIEVLMDEELETHFEPNKKIILYVGRRYDYGNKNWGLSYQHFNIYHTLLNMDCSIIYFDYDRISQKYGANKMSQMLREAVYYYHPDILFYFHSYDRIKHAILTEISGELSTTTTVIFLSDDHFEYEDTRHIWELFNIIVTTDVNGYNKRKKEGFNNVLLSQYACNHFLYRDLNLPRTYDVSFVGRPHGIRRDFIKSLKKQGVNVTIFGQGWEHSSRVSQADLIRIYNQSKISLNISLTSRGGKIQIKSRDFEAPGCGSLLLTKDTKEILEYFVPGEEIITYRDVNDAVEIIKYYIENDDERVQIAKKGYERINKEHTIEKRLVDIFEFAQNMGMAKL